MITGRQNLLPAGGRASFADRRRGLLRWLPAFAATGAILILTFGSTAVVSADPTTPLTITFSVEDKVYDGNALSTASACQIVEDVSPDDVTCDATASVVTFDGEDVGTHVVEGTSGFALAGEDSAGYHIETITDASADITAATLTITATGEDKVYNGDDTADVTFSDDRVSGDDVEVSYDTATFDDGKDVGTGKAISVTGITISGDDAGNYDANTTAATSADITQRDLTVDATGVNRGYDGTTTATVTWTDDRVSGDDIDIDYTANFNNRDAGNGKSISVTGISISGTDAPNYNLTNTSDTTSANVAKAPLTVTAVVNIKTADGTTSAAATPTTSGTIYSPDSIAGQFTETYDTPAAAANKTLTPAGVVSDGNSGNNYEYDYDTVSTGRIRPAVVASISFTAQPVDTEVSTPIYSNCVAAPSGNPCQAVPTSSPVLVTARDAFGNLAGPGAPGADGSNAVINVSIRRDSASGTPLSSGVATAAGIASFGNGLTITATTPSARLYAATGATINTLSSTFQVVSDLEACVGLTCDNKAATGGSTTQTTFGKIKSGNNFNNTVTLTTQFLSKVVSQNPDANRCVNTQNAPALGQMTEVKVQGGGVSATQPNFTMVMIFPKKTLQAEDFSSRGTDKFNVCLGATWLDTGTATPWRAKTSLTNATLTNAQEVVAGSKVYWGWAPDCASLTPAQRLTNPCITLRTKQVATLRTQLVPSVMNDGDFTALGMKDSDVAIVISKPWPWDGKGIVR